MKRKERDGHGNRLSIQNCSHWNYVAVLNQLLIRSGREEQAMMTTLAGLIVVLTMVVSQISQLFQLIKQLFQL